MNIFEQLKPQIDAFKAARDHVVSTVTLPEVGKDINYGKPPFAIDDGSKFYAVIDSDGKASPLPFGYQVPIEYLEADDTDCILTIPVSLSGSGLEIIRYVPLGEDFEIPGDRSFCLEAAEGSAAWELVGEFVDRFKDMVAKLAMPNFNQEFLNAIIRLYDGFEELESVDHTIGVFLAETTAPLTLMLRAYQHALDELEMEMNVEDDD